MTRSLLYYAVTVANITVFPVRVKKIALTTSPNPIWSVDNMPPQDGRIAIVTGGNSGIGLETVRALAGKGATVYMASRNEAKARNALSKLKSDTETRKGHVDFLPLDLGSFESIQRCVHLFQDSQSHLDMLFNCAATLDPNCGQTSEGFELHFGVNVVGPYYLTRLLIPFLIKSFQLNPMRPPRVCFTSSMQHLYATSKGFDPSDPSGEKGFHVLPKFIQAYNNSKMAVILIANKLNSEYCGDGIIFSSCNPGNVKTDLSRHIVNLSSVWIGNLLGPRVLYPPEMGALTQLYACTSLEAGEGGAYYVPWARRGEPSPIAKDPKVQDSCMYTCDSPCPVIRFLDQLIALRTGQVV